MVRGRLAATPGRRGAASKVCRPSSTGSGSRTSRTSISGCRRAGDARCVRPSSGWSSGTPTSSASPATSSRVARGSPNWRNGCDNSTGATSSSATTTSPTAATRSRNASIPATLAAISGVTLLSDESVERTVAGRRVQIVGVDPRTYARREARPADAIDETADLRILLCHFPGIARRVPEGAFHLILAGHLHAGQIVVPYPGGKLRLAHLRARDVEGVYEYGATTLHVSPGLGTTFVPFRLFARPEVTEVVVRSA